MNRFLLCTFFLSLLAATTMAQSASSDQLETSEGMVSIQPVLHGTVAFTWNDQTIYVDPYGGAEAFAGIDAPDLILITDIHGDHMDVKTLEAIETTDVPMVVPQAVADQLPESFQEQLVIIGNGESTEQLGVSIEALPMYNLPENDPDSRHTKGRGNGYLLTFGDKTVYLSGDTEDIEEMRALEDIDVAFVCMNLPYTMSVDQAASAVLEFEPVMVYPYHYRGTDGLSDVEKFKELVNAENEDIEVRLRAWYPEN
uniref:MBL fold metallo-hydrolase n=1 Tax=Roseihalotalea indica TaxID=2867963 RepID=A0AA49JJI3_9BACT|nr:MBL fold metallo-hydrolase [Tunicatimonas sp. TK19036]